MFGWLKNKITSPFSWLGGKIKGYLIKKALNKLIKEIPMLNWLKGKKTYIVSLIGAIIAVGSLLLKVLNGEPVSMDDVIVILELLGIGGLRAGIAKK